MAKKTFANGVSAPTFNGKPINPTVNPLTPAIIPNKEETTAEEITPIETPQEASTHPTVKQEQPKMSAAELLQFELKRIEKRAGIVKKRKAHLNSYDILNELFEELLNTNEADFESKGVKLTLLNGYNEKVAISNPLVVTKFLSFTLNHLESAISKLETELLND